MASDEGREAAQSAVVQAPNQGGKGRGKSKELQASLEGRVTRTETILSDCMGRVEADEERIEKLEEGSEELRNEAQELRNEMLEALNSAVGMLRDELTKRILELEGELSIYRRALANGMVGSQSSTKVDVPRPKAYSGARNAKEIDNFLYSMELYFDAICLKDDAEKLRTVPMYLHDVAILWWRRRSEDIKKGSCTIETWDEFKTEIKKMFYPENAEDEARGRLRRLSQKGTIREYVKEFSDLTLQIPDLGEKESLFAFMDGLATWAKLELQRRGVQTLAQAIAAAESLIDLRAGRDESKPQRGEHSRSNRSHERGQDRERDQYLGERGKDDRDRSERRTDKPKEKYRDKPVGKWRDRDRSKPLECHFCDGPHLVRDCPQRGKLAALIRADDECQETEREEGRIGSLRLLNAMEGKMAQSAKGPMFVETKVSGHAFRALLDTGATHVFISSKAAARIGLKVCQEGGTLKAVNSKPMAIEGTVRGVEISMGQWRGRTDMSVVPMDDYDLVLGLEFLEREKAVVIPHANTLCLMEGASGTVPIVRGMSQQKDKIMSAMQLSRGLQKKEPTYLAVLVEQEEPKPPKEVPKEVAEVLEEFADVVRTDLPESSQAGQERARKNELVSRVSPPAGEPVKLKSGHANQEAEQMRDDKFKVGDRVLIKLAADVQNKMTYRERMRQPEGPFKVLRKIGRDEYELELPPHLKRFDPVFPADMLKPYHAVEKANRDISGKTASGVSEGCKPKVERILAKRKGRDAQGQEQIEYLVQWRGKPISEASWEPALTLWEFEGAIKRFHRQTRQRGRCQIEWGRMSRADDGGPNNGTRPGEKRGAGKPL